MKQKKRFNAAAFAGFLLVLIWGAALAQVLTEKGDKWWTPVKMMVPPEKCADKVEVRVAGRPLADVLKDKTLLLAEKDGSFRPLKEGEVLFRLNTWDARRAGNYAWGMILSAFTAVGLTLLVIGLSRLRKDKGEASK